VPNASVQVHPHPGEAGAIGAALETLRVVTRRGSSTFIGLQAAVSIGMGNPSLDRADAKTRPEHGVTA